MPQHDLLLTPLKFEFNYLLKSLEKENLNFEIEKFKNKEIFHCKEFPFSLSYADLGKVNFAIHALDLASHIQKKINLKSIVLLGSCGSLVSELNVADIILGTETFEFDFKSMFGAKSGEKKTIQNNWINFFKSSSNFDFLKFGTIASGDEDIVTEDRSKDVHKLTNALVTAWEGAGLYKVGQYLNLPTVEIRGVTDHCNSSTTQDFKQNMNLIMNNISKIIIHYYRSL